MPGVIGPFGLVFTSMEPLEAHAAHLRHLVSPRVARRLVLEKFDHQPPAARKIGTLLSSHVGQALHFHEASLEAHRSVRPMLQYYSYLNLAVGVVLAHQPPNVIQYRRHGVEDRSHELATLSLQSRIVRVSRSGAVPLFHSIVSGESIRGRCFRLNELIGCIPMVRFELQNLFGLSGQEIIVSESVEEDKGYFLSRVQLDGRSPEGTDARLSRQRVEKAMPDLARDYKLREAGSHTLVYLSRKRWMDYQEAQAVRGSNEPLPFAAVRIVEEPFGTIAGDDGKYIIPDVPAGQYDLKVSHIGYETYVHPNVAENSILAARQTRALCPQSARQRRTGHAHGRGHPGVRLPHPPRRPLRRHRR